jgi:hypothetical protein
MPCTCLRPTPCPVGGCPPTPTCPRDCFIAASHVVPPDQSIGACGQNGSVDLLAINTDADTFCTGAMSFSVYSYDAVGLTNVSVSNAGLLTFTTTSAAVPNQLYNIMYRIYCNGTIYSSMGNVWIGILDLCTLACATGTLCNKCTGVCDPILIDVSTSIASGQCNYIDVSV